MSEFIDKFIKRLRMHFPSRKVRSIILYPCLVHSYVVRCMCGGFADPFSKPECNLNCPLSYIDVIAVSVRPMSSTYSETLTTVFRKCPIVMYCPSLFFKFRLFFK